MAQASRNQNAETMVHTAFAMIRLVAGKYPEAMGAAQAALAVAEKSGDRMFCYSSNSFMAWALTGLGEHQRALEHWSAAHKAARSLGGRLLLGEWLAAIESDTLLGAGDIPAALKKGEEALAIAKAAGSLIAEALSESAIGNALAAGSTPDYENAEAHLARSLSLLESIGAKFDLARVSLALGRVRIGAERLGGRLKTAAAGLRPRLPVLAANGGSKGAGPLERDRDGPGSGFGQLNEVLKRFAWRRRLRPGRYQ